MQAVIICGGSVTDYDRCRKILSQDAFIICADDGARHLRKINILPDLLLGDFDSIGAEDLAYYGEKGIEIIKYPVEKDKTDSEIAVDYALERGFKNLVILGATGSRLDHTLSNIFLLKKILDSGGTGCIINENNEIYLISDSIRLKKEERCNVTLLAITKKVTGVTTKGLYYQLQDAEIYMGSSFGVSNVFTDEYAEVSIKSGLLLVIKSRD